MVDGRGSLVLRGIRNAFACIVDLGHCQFHEWSSGASAEMCQQHIKRADWFLTNAKFHHVQKYAGSLAVRFTMAMSRALHFEVVPCATGEDETPMPRETSTTTLSK